VTSGVHGNDWSKQSLFVDGQWSAAADGGTREIHSPHDGSLVRVVAEATAADTHRAIAAARAAFDDGRWSALPWLQRGALLSRVADLMQRDHAELSRLESEDTGKRLVESGFDIDDVISVFRYCAGVDEPGPADSGVTEAGVSSVVVHEPLGVAGLITPWNYPLLQVSWKAAPALLAGCTFVLKPSELTPSTAVHLMRLLAEAGLPDGVANLVLGAGAAAGAPLATDPRVDIVSFTGGLATGRVLMAAAAATVKKVALELGGKNPNIIFADADLDAAIDNTVTFAFLHSGQVCSAGSRLLVERGIHDRVVTELARRADAIRLGGPDDPQAETGALISAGHREKVERYLAAAVAEGAVLVSGGTRPTDPALAAGNYLRPAVLDHCRTEMRCVQDEAFGPTVTVEVFDTEAEAIRLGNDTVYGLSGAVWTADAERGARVAAALRHGTIWVNDAGPYRAAAEWGGYKQSGVGRELGHAGLAEYQEIKHIWTREQAVRSGWFRDSQLP